MNFITSSEDKPFAIPNVATIGFFDGVHRGHRFLIEQVRQYAHSQGMPSLLITFRTHPRQVMQADYQPKLLSTLTEKKELLADTGADYCAILEFTSRMSHLSAREFMSEVLKDRLNVKMLVIGYDHRFGHGRTGGFSEYVEYGKELGIEVRRAEPLTLSEIPVSSSVTRAFLSEGEVEMAARCLMRPYALNGIVTSGFQIGRELGFPTANLQIEDMQKLIPKGGVYAVRVTDALTPSKVYAGMLNVGVRPTVGNGADLSVEVHILHFEGDLYGHQLTVEFMHRLRDEKKFRNKGELVNQLRADALAVEDMWNNFKMIKE